MSINKIYSLTPEEVEVIEKFRTRSEKAKLWDSALTSFRTNFEYIMRGKLTTIEDQTVLDAVYKALDCSHYPYYDEQ